MKQGEKAPNLSIVVPAFCAERYLDRCIQSIVDQTFAAFETILIDDGSTDSTGEICDVWAKKDTRIKVLHTTNQGLSAARNTGLRLAVGEWVLFVDADDVLAPNALIKLMSAAKDTDIVAFGWALIDESGQQLRTCLPREEKRGNAQLLLNEIVAGPLSDYAWSYLFRRTLFNEEILTDLPEGRGPFNESLKLYEDVAFLQDFLRNNDIKVSCTRLVVYLHRRARGSLSRKPNVGNAQSGLQVVRFLSQMTTPSELMDAWNAKLIMLLIGVFQLTGGKEGIEVRRGVRLEMKNCMTFGSFCNLTVLGKIKYLLWRAHLYRLAQRAYRTVAGVVETFRRRAK